MHKRLTGQEEGGEPEKALQQVTLIAQSHFINL